MCVSVRSMISFQFDVRVLVCSITQKQVSSRFEFGFCVHSMTCVHVQYSCEPVHVPTLKFPGFLTVVK